MKFRVIQSNNRGLISRVGDKTFSSRKPKKGEENIELPTLFIWVKSPKRLDIEDNIYVLKIIHSVYKAIFNNKNYQLIRDKEFRLK